MQLEEIAGATEGYSGADLQALLYNAHLEVVHSSIAATPLDGPTATREDDAPVQFTVIGGPKSNKVTSKADEMALQRRVCSGLQILYMHQLTLRPQLRQIKSKAQARRDESRGVSSTPQKVRLWFRPFADILTSFQHEITAEHLSSVLKTMRPSVSAEERARLDRM